MTNSREISTPGDASLPSLLRQYLEREAAARGSGFGRAEPRGEVVPFDAGSSQFVNPKIAWEEALAAAKFYGEDFGDLIKETPSNWPAMVAEAVPQCAVPMCLGNYPQLVSDLSLLRSQTELAKLKPIPKVQDTAAGLASASLSEPTPAGYSRVLLTAAMWQLSGNYDQAADLLLRNQGRVPDLSRWAWANEEAALNWHRGKAEPAAASWRALPARAPVLFNRGMAALFSDRPSEARPLLNDAISQLPQSSSWYHLGALYLALAELRS